MVIVVSWLMDAKNHISLNFKMLSNTIRFFAYVLRCTQWGREYTTISTNGIGTIDISDNELIFWVYMYSLFDAHCLGSSTDFSHPDFDRYRSDPEKNVLFES